MITVGERFQSSRSGKASRRFLALVLSILLLTVAVSAAILAHAPTFPRPHSEMLFPVFQPQAPAKSKIEVELERKNAPSRTPGSTNKGRKKPRSGSSHTTAAPKDFSVTFVTDVGGAEIALDDKVLGKTEVNKRLTTKIKKGQYRATASLKGYNRQSMTISVFSNNTTFTLNLGKPIPVPTPAPTPVAKAAATPVPPPPTPSADEIIKRFVNPQETNKLSSEDWRGVIAQSEAGLKSSPANPQFEARLHLGRGQLAYLNKNYAEALSESNRAIVALPLSGIAYYCLGNVYLATNQPLPASKSYQRAIALTPELAALAYKGIGNALTKLFNPKEANASYRRARDLGNLSPEINKSIALNLIKQKEWQKALSELSAIESNDSSAELHLYLGECYENLKRPLSAYRAYITATKIDPNSPVAFSKLGDILYAHNEFPEAREAYERALALDTTGAAINRQLVRKLADTAASRAR